MAVLVAVYLVKGIHYEKPLDLLAASLLLGILNAVFRPVLLLLAWPLLVFTLGLLYFVINALLLYFVGSVMRPHFWVENFWSAFFGALIISFVSTVLSVLTGTGKARVKFERQRGDKRNAGGGNGPVIDV
jgi:putative membrane protein